MEYAFRVKQIIGGVESGLTGLVKADVTVRAYDNPAVVYDYDTLGEIGNGNYVIYGLAFTERDCRIYIYDVSQLWLGIIRLGNVIDAARIPALSADKITSGTLGVARIPNLDAAKITTGVLDVARIPNLSAGKITSDTLAEARLPSSINALKIGGGIVGSENFDKLQGVREFIQSRMDSSPAMQTNSLIVDSTFVASGSVNKFQTIQGAINYAQAKTPALMSPWFIYIMPTNDGGYVENITLQPYINLIGMGLIHITGTLSGGSLNSLLQNVYFSYLGNSTISYIKAINSIFRVTNGDTGYQLTLGSNILLNCGFLNVGVAEFNPRIISSGSNTFIKCWSNIQTEIHATDKGSVDSLESISTNF